jgi:GntR family transcriptional regulator
MTVKHSYLDIVDLIKTKIENRELKPQDLIPSEKDLREMTGIGRSTIRKGLSLLVNDGYIYPVQGKGYYVQAANNDEFILFFNETSAIETSADSIFIIGVDIQEPSPMLTDRLRLPPQKKVVKIERMITDGSLRIAFDCKFIPYSSKSPIVEKELYNATFPQMFAKERCLFEIRKSIRITVGKADREMAKVLRSPENEPIIIIEQQLFDENDEPLGFGITKFRGEHFKIKAVSQ